MNGQSSKEITTSTIKIQELPNLINQLTSQVERSSKETMEIIKNLYGDIISVFKLQSEQTRQCIIDFLNIKDRTESSKEFITRYVEMNNQFMTMFTEKIAESIKKFSTNENCELSIDKQTLCANKIFDKKLKERKQLYWKYHRAKSICGIYENELNSESPKMPRKFRPVEIYNEPKEELKIREQLSLQKFKLETDLLRIRSQRFEKDFCNIDREIIQYFQSELPKLESNKLIKEWINNCYQEEQKSIKIFKKHESWIKNNLTKDLRTKSRKRIKTDEISSNTTKENEIKKLKPRWGRKKKLNGYKSSNKEHLNAEIAVRHF